MSPKRYLWLRRTNLARQALRRANAEETTVTEIASDYGFWELGRFSVAYRSLFGESRSKTRHGTPTLFAALNVLDDKVIGQCMSRHRHQEFIRFLNQISRQTPAAQEGATATH